MKEVKNSLNHAETSGSMGGTPMRLTLIVSAIMVVLWAFPGWWYTKTDTGGDRFWFSATESMKGYAFVDQPIGESMERALVADETFNAQFLPEDGRPPVLAFMAKRHEESVNEIGLFVHTPDRCWTQGGWKIQPVQPDYVEVEVHGYRIGFERRLFVAGPRHELVYFAGLVGGQTLPYRLDHNLSVAMKYQIRDHEQGATGTSHRFVDQKLWGRVWDAFTSRRPLLGPKQFIRVSTQVYPEDVDRGDAVLKAFIQEWLQPVDYQQELEAWKASQKSPIS